LILYSFWPLRTFIASMASGITSPPLMSTPSMSNAKANLSVVWICPSSGVVAVVESFDSLGVAPGVVSGDPSAKWCFANSMAWAVPWALLGIFRCFGGATTVGPAKRSSLFACIEESRLGTILERLRAAASRVSVGASKLLLTFSSSAVILGVSFARRDGMVWEEIIL
jgi:hypothetical protein